MSTDRPPLTERQTQVYEFIRDTLRRDGRPPTFAEMGRSLGIASTHGVHRLVVALEAKGYVRRRPNEARGLSVVDADEARTPGGDAPGVLMLRTAEGVGRRARLLTADTAEHPLPRSRRPLLVDPALLPDDVDLDACLGAIAGDDGMSADGIRKDDLLVVEEAEWTQVPNGALVAALFHDRLVVRRFELANGRLHFRAAHRTYRDRTAHPDDTAYFVIGRVVALMRPLG